MTRPNGSTRRGDGRHRHDGTARGFSAVELLCTCAVAAVIVSIALPGYEGQLQKARRNDAVAALTRLQAAQERLRAEHGLYGSSLDALQLPARSADGLYTLALEATGPNGYTAKATAVAGGPQAADADCAQLALQVNDGFAQFGPSTRCWNR